ncbi:MAG: hypothetical protein DRH79_08235 [Candidatus Cloacimonadota bacterium]|nr:MAG: hypothetical protein DRH79_08235 [Candidatus Cloacimonadota bacterium]
MKKRFLIILIAITTLYLYSLKNWQVYTNTTHIFDIVSHDNKLYTATWGGLEVYDINSDSFVEKYTTINGLANNDIRAIQYNDLNNEFYLGTNGNGVIRMKEGEFKLPIDKIIGLASDFVNDIVVLDSLVYIATTGGLSVFWDNPEFPFPFLVDNYDTGNGLTSNDISILHFYQNYLICGSDLGLDFAHVDSLDSISSWYHIDSNNSSIPSSVVSSISSNSSDLVVGTNNGIFKISNLFDFSQAEIIMNGYAIYPVFLDANDDLWFSYGFWDNSLLNLQDSINIAISRFESDGNVTEWNDLNTTKIKEFYEFDDQFIATTWGEGIYAFDGSEWSTQIKQNCIVANVVTDLVIDLNDKLWVSNGHVGGGLTTKGTRGVSSFDGFFWNNFSAESSPLNSDNIYCMSVDQYNRKWFGSWSNAGVDIWSGGISIYNDEVDEWKYINKYNVEPMISNTIGVIVNDGSNTWVGMYWFGVIIFDENDEPVHTFDLYQPDPGNDFSDIFELLITNERIVTGGAYNGIRLWQDLSFPENNGPFWEKPAPTDLRGGWINDFAFRDNNGVEEVWIASDGGLFMYNGTDWFLYGTSIKKKVWQNNSWFWSENDPDPTYWYYEGQPRLYGSNPTYPTALFIDPFGSIWIGTGDSGFTIFNPERDTFVTYNKNNSPLVSNYISSFVYVESSGILYIGTNDGLNSVEIGIPEVNNTETKLAESYAYPNPFYPDKGDIVRIENKGKLTMPKGKVTCRIFDLNGELIIELNKNIYEQFSWDGKNSNGKKCSSGLYYYLISAPDGQAVKGKIALIR